MCVQFGSFSSMSNAQKGGTYSMVPDRTEIAFYPLKCSHHEFLITYLSNGWLRVWFIFVRNVLFCLYSINIFSHLTEAGANRLPSIPRNVITLIYIPCPTHVMTQRAGVSPP